MAAGLTVGNGIRVILTDGAQAGNIFWQVGTTATIGTGAAFNGTIMAHAAVTMASTSTMTGRALAGTAVTFDGSSITLPSTVTQDYGTIVLVTNGYGTIQHGVWPTNMVIGSHYTVRAVPAPENVFSNWVGGTAQPYSVLSTSASYTFVMQSNLTLEANIVTNPFIPITGIYNGLFTTPGGVTEQTAGMLERLTVDKKGTYSGTLLINGGSHVVSGRFDLSGQATNKIARLQSRGGPLLVEMALNRDNFPLQVTGTVSGTNDGAPWVANLMADLAANNLSSAEYIMLLPPDTNNTPPTLSPGGDGYALITNHQSSVKNPDAAIARITGALADGTAFNQTVPVSQDGYVPIYANLYDSKGLLLGWINLDLTNTTGVSLTWIHPKRAAGLYKNGFTNVFYTNQILLSPWTNSSEEIGRLINLSMLDTINDASALTNIVVTTTAAGKVTGTSVKGTIDLKTGLLKVTIGRDANKVTGFGAILLNATNGGGYFLTKTNGHAIKLEP